jgi:hypothetical protein
VLGLVAPHDDGEERRLLLPPARHRHPEPGPGDAAVGVADLGVVGEVAEAIAASLAARPHDREALVFTAPMGGPLSRADFVRNYFKPAVLAANEAMTKLPKDQRPALLPEGLRFYDLRHTCASLLIAQGATVKAVEAQLGHATASITLDTYGHLFPSEMEALANRLELVRDAALAKRGRTQYGPAGSA